MATIACSLQSATDCGAVVRGHDRARDVTEYHRIAEVRAQQGLSLRAIARRTGLEVRELKQQELSTTNLSLEDLYRWADALEVPVSNLLIDQDQELSEPVRSRASLVKVMKTVVALNEVTTSPRIARMTQMLREQLIEMMPELAEVGGWPTFGSRRPPDQVGRIAANPIPIDSLSTE
jgi:transcriptional regulator with XRE-family HTH domain